MKRDFIDDIAKAEKELFLKKGLIELIFNTAQQIEIPSGAKEPELRFSWGSGCRGLFISIDQWPLEMSCSYVAELEMLLNTESISNTEHYYSEKASAIYTFFQGLDLQFNVINFDAQGCKVTVKGDTSFASAKIECK